MEIVRRKDNNKIFKLCYDLGDSLCEVYKLVDGEYRSRGIKNERIRFTIDIHAPVRASCG